MRDKILNWFMSAQSTNEALKARCPSEYLDNQLLPWAQEKGDLNPLIEFFETRTHSIRLRPAMLKFLAEVLRRTKKPNKKIARLATGKRQFEIATDLRWAAAMVG